MSESNEQNFISILAQLRKSIKEKNQIINHLTNRIKNQEKQISMLIKDSEERHFHQITKHYKKNYEKYMKNGKYLLIKLDEMDADEIYLPKCGKIVHFGQIQLVKDTATKQENINALSEKKVRVNEQSNQKIRNFSVNKQDKKQKQNLTLQTSLKQLSKQIQILKEQFQFHNPNITKKQAIIHPIEDGIEVKQKDRELVLDHYIAKFPSPSPIKKRKHTKTIFIRR